MGCRERNWIRYEYKLVICAGIVRQIEALAQHEKAIAWDCETMPLTSTPDMLNGRKRVGSVVSRLTIEGIQVGKTCFGEMTVNVDTNPISSTESYA